MSILIPNDKFRIMNRQVKIHFYTFTTTNLKLKISKIYRPKPSQSKTSLQGCAIMKINISSNLVFIYAMHVGKIFQLNGLQILEYQYFGSQSMYIIF